MDFRLGYEHYEEKNLTNGNMFVIPWCHITTACNLLEGKEVFLINSDSQSVCKKLSKSVFNSLKIFAVREDPMNWGMRRGTRVEEIH